MTQKIILNAQNWGYLSEHRRSWVLRRLSASGVDPAEVLFIEIDGGDITTYRLHLNSLGIHASGHCETGEMSLTRDPNGTFMCDCGMTGLFTKDSHKVCTEATVV